MADELPSSGALNTGPAVDEPTRLVFAVCHDIVRQLGKICFLPINFSTIGGTVAVFQPDSPTLQSVLGDGSQSVMKTKIINHWIEQVKSKDVDTSILVDKFANNDRPAQTGHGAFATAALVSELILMMTQGEKVETFPYVHLHTRR